MSTETFLQTVICSFDYYLHQKTPFRGVLEIACHLL